MGRAVRVYLLKGRSFRKVFSLVASLSVGKKRNSLPAASIIVNESVEFVEFVEFVIQYQRYVNF
jgi:hypothetical protein